MNKHSRRAHAFISEYKYTMIIILLLFSNAFLILDCTSLFQSQKSWGAAVVNQQVLLHSYSQTLKIKVGELKNQSQMKKYLDKCNKHFLSVLANILTQYELKHHVIIFKKATLIMPNSQDERNEKNVVHSEHFDVTEEIESQLKERGVL